MAKNLMEIYQPSPALQELTADDATEMTLKNFRGGVIYLYPSTSSTAPAYTPQTGLPIEVGLAVVNQTLAELFVGFTGPVRVFAEFSVENSYVFMSHN